VPASSSAMGDRAGAEACYLRRLQTSEPNHYASVDTGLRGYKARYHLALQLVIDQRQELAGCLWIALVNPVEDASEVLHTAVSSGARCD